MYPAAIAACCQELTKVALLERLVRLGATDIPKTPRLLMKHRDPKALAALQHATERVWDSKVTSPLMRVADHGLKHIPEGKARRLATAGAHLVAEDPVGFTVTHAIPLPGVSPAWIAAKKGLEHAIDKVSPLQV